MVTQKLQETIDKSQEVCSRILKLAEEWKASNAADPKFLHLSREDELHLWLASAITHHAQTINMTRRPKFLLGFEVVYDAVATKASEQKEAI